MASIREVFKKHRTPAERTHATKLICEAIKNGELETVVDANKGTIRSKLSLRDIAESTLGEAGMRALGNMHEEGDMAVGLREAVDAVNLSAFTNITGQLVLRGAYAAYAAPEFIGTRLVTEETDTEDLVRIPGLMDIDDDAQTLAENEEYDTVKFGEDYIDRPTSQKRGARIALTREMVFFDKTGQLGQLSSALGRRLGLNKEVRILRLVLGVDNPFNRKGVARNTYVASADPRINKNVTSKPMTDWTSFDYAQQLIASYVDDKSKVDAEPIMVNLRQVLVPQALEMTARRIMGATQIRVNTQSAAQTAIGANPLPSMDLIASPWVNWVLVKKGGLTSGHANARWYIGDFKAGFRYVTLFPFALEQAPANHPDNFSRDTVAQWKCSERGVPYVYQPWQAVMLGDE